MRWTAGLLALSLTVASLSAAPRRVRELDRLAKGLEPDSTAVYQRTPHRDLRLHIFNPPGHRPTDRRAALVVIHGGGWAGGEPRWFYPIADHFRDLGLVGICIEYRLLGQHRNHTVFDCVRDGRAAVRYVRRHAAELGIDPRRVIVSGGSAGGHVAVGTAMFSEVDPPGAPPDISPVPDALVLFYPVIDTSADGYGQKKIGDRWRELSPVEHVRSCLPPTLVLHGDGDTVTPHVGAVRFHQRMLASGNDCILITQPGGVHGYFVFDLALYDEMLRQVIGFLRARGLIP
jgi:acetyl esterase